ncbi:MAG: ferrochelatase [Eubacteriales bacterium]
MSIKPTGVLLLAFGGPDSPEAIEPFMKNLMGGRVPPPALVEKVKARYDLIGGKSPLPGITSLQAKKLEEHLQAHDGNYRVAVGMRHWHPFIKEGVDSLLADDIDTIVAVSLAPFYSQVSTGAYKEELDAVVASLGSRKPALIMTDPLYNKPRFLDAVAEKVSAGLNGFPADKRGEVRIIFSAHSLPMSYIQEGDPYVRQFETAVKGIVEHFQLQNYYIAYQSKGGGQGEWLAPMVEDIMDEIKQDGFTDVLVVPVGFVSDHIETLYDIDIAQKSHAASLGLNFHRTASLNSSGLFIRALAETVLEKV